MDNVIRLDCFTQVLVTEYVIPYPVGTDSD